MHNSFTQEMPILKQTDYLLFKGGKWFHALIIIHLKLQSEIEHATGLSTPSKCFSAYRHPLTCPYWFFVSPKPRLLSVINNT